MTYTIPQHLVKALTYPDLKVAEISAIKAVAAGRATGEQQQRAWNTILEKLAGVYDLEMILGGDDGRRVTDIRSGKRMVGLNLMKIANVPTDMQSTEDELKETKSMSSAAQVQGD